MNKHAIKITILKEFLRKNNAYELYRYNMLDYFGQDLSKLKHAIRKMMIDDYTRMISGFFYWEEARGGDKFWDDISSKWRIEINSRRKEWE